MFFFQLSRYLHKGKEIKKIRKESTVIVFKGKIKVIYVGLELCIHLSANHFVINKLI